MANRKKSTSKQEDLTHLLPVLRPAIDGTERRRPPAITPVVLERLRQAFLIGCDDEEAALHAGISAKTLYNHQKANQDFLQWKQALKQTPFLTARKTIVDNLSRDPEFALKYMERKKKGEFSPTAKITLEDGNAVIVDDEQKAKVGNMLATHFAKLAERSANGQ